MNCIIRLNFLYKFFRMTKYMKVVPTNYNYFQSQTDTSSQDG